MTTNLSKTDVVVIGLGATGGVAVLPLTQAGIDVVAIEAGTWLQPKDFAPDELRNNFRACIPCIGYLTGPRYRSSQSSDSLITSKRAPLVLHAFVAIRRLERHMSRGQGL